MTQEGEMAPTYKDKPTYYKKDVDRLDSEKSLESMKIEIDFIYATKFGIWLAHIKGLNPFSVSGFQEEN